MIIIALFSSVVNAANIDDPNHRKIEYKEIATMLSFATQKARSPFIKIQAKVSIQDPNKKMSDLKMWISRNKKIIKTISIADDGNLDLPVYSDQDAKKTWLNINQPKDTVSLSMSFNFNIGDKTEVSYYDLFILLDDFNDFMGEMAGVASWFMSDMDAMRFVFDKPATISINTQKKKYQYTTNKKNEISIDVKRKLYKENPMVKFSIELTHQRNNASIDN